MSGDTASVNEIELDCELLVLVLFGERPRGVAVDTFEEFIR
jgi:hypothetical protein